MSGNTSTADQLFLNQVIEALKSGLGNRLVAIVLFGSRVRGDALALGKIPKFRLVPGVGRNRRMS